MKKNLSIFGLALAALLLLAACGVVTSSSAAATASSTVAEPSNEPAATSSSAPPAAQSAPATVTLSIGYDGQEKTVEYDIGGQVLSPEVLIASIANTTGWDLSLAGSATQEGEKITVPFSSASALFSGPPDPQKDEYHVFDTEDLVFSVLGSVSETLKQNLGVTDVYFCGEGGAPLVIPNLAAQDVTLPADEPYSKAALDALIAAA